MSADKPKLSWGDGPTQYFFNLTPDTVMTALEAQPILGEKRFCTGYCQPLASFENRVYEIEFESAEGVKTRAVSKFYRPGRWSREQILEEHEFMQDILKAEVPVVVPHFFEKEGDTLRQSKEGLFFCVYPKVGGRQPEDLNADQLQQLGRLIARMHVTGSQKPAPHRVQLTPAIYGTASLEFLLAGRYVNPQIEARFAKVVRTIVEIAEKLYVGHPLQRIHGDCHAGNILWNEKTGPAFIDFDDMVVGPPVQDLWLLAPDPLDLHELMEGYQMMRDLPKGSFLLVESLRALRMIHYATWIAKRYEDPAFKRAFPQFESPKYWDELTYDLERQLERMIAVSDYFPWGSAPGRLHCPTESSRIPKKGET
jgi:Ser/Thr protein kinase RdoA (MazF antagonist)